MDVLMPQLGETVSSGKITTWFKKVGDTIAAGDNLFEIETDKTSMDVPATSAGILTEIRVGDGVEAPVGAIVAVIAGGAEAAPPLHAPVHVPPASAKLDPFHEVRTPLGQYGKARLAGGGTITPLARRLAKEAGIDPAGVTGSGPRGRIVRRDIAELSAKGIGKAVAAPLAASAPGPTAAAPLAAGAAAEQVKSLYRDRPYEELPLDPMRRSIARRLVEAKQTIPHFYLVAEYDVDALLSLRKQANVTAPMNENGAPAYKLSVNDFIVKAFALALQRVPTANAVWAEDRVLRLKNSDIGVAVAIEGGLIVPVVRDAETKSLAAISTEIKRLASRARDRKLQPAEYQGGVSTVSNLGGHGVREFSAIINPPHATILAVGATRRQPVETADGGFKFASQMTVTLSCDHRVVDGAVGAELLEALRGFIEAPVRIVL
jgi:pyruvate dehydrogenase E2 component (dihydrolipoamide acetyltransferase)